VIERLAPLPSKPQSVIIERWLPYSGTKRRVIFNRATQPDPVTLKPRNVVVQWEAPEVVIRKDFKYLGVVRANPVEYVQRFGHSLVVSDELPDFVKEIKTPDDIVLAANHDSSKLSPELEGDVEALRLVDLDKEGLSEYKSLFQNNVRKSTSFANKSTLTSPIKNLAENSQATASAGSLQLASASQATANQLANLVEILFQQIDRHDTGSISVEDAEKLVLRLNSRLGRAYGEDDVKAFFTALDKNEDGQLNLEEFKEAFIQAAL
jgi:Ca2+-binding EF-hand superfamily protein